MSPSIENLEKQISREVYRGDLLIGKNGLLYEVVEKTGVPQGSWPDSIRLIITKVSTQAGLSSTQSSFRNDHDLFEGIIRAGDRADNK
jgi:hypothetical protein